MACPGPSGAEWRCDGRACTVGGIHTTCKIAKEKDGYVFTYTQRAQIAENTYQQLKRSRLSTAHKS